MIAQRGVIVKIADRTDFRFLLFHHVAFPRISPYLHNLIPYIGRNKRSSHYCSDILLVYTMYPFPDCTSIAVTGATCSGKTFWVYRLLRHKDEMFENPPEKVLYCYGIYQPLFGEMEKELPFITFHQGLPSTADIEELSNLNSCNLICLDDLMESVTSSSEMETLFVKGMHHRHLSILFLNQNLYCQCKHSRTISLNTHILVLMKNPRD